MFIIYRNFTKQNERLVLLFQTSANNLIKLLYNATVYLKNTLISDCILKLETVMKNTFTFNRSDTRAVKT